MPGSDVLMCPPSTRSEKSVGDSDVKQSAQNLADYFEQCIDDSFEKPRTRRWRRAARASGGHKNTVHIKVEYRELLFGVSVEKQSVPAGYTTTTAVA